MNNDDAKIITFQMEEAKFIDQVVRPYIPNIFHKYKAFLGKGKQGVIKRFQHFFIDYVLIARILKVRITRHQDTEIIGGKGFRPGYSKTRLNKVRTTVFKGKQQIAEKAFNIGIIIN